MEFIFEIVSTGNITYVDSIKELDNQYGIKGWTDENHTLREELIHQPKLWDYLGPMYGGTKDGKIVIRYESQEAYNAYSQ